MRSIHRSAITVAVAAALVVSVTVAPSVAAGATKKGNPIQKLSKRVTTVSRNLNKLSVNVHSLQGTVNQGIPIITQLVNGLQQAGSGLTALQGGLTALQSALTTVGNGLKALQTAVQDPTTGLPGLNAARNLVGAVVTDAAASGSEFTLAGHAANVPAAGDVSYVLSFKDGQGNAADVSKRVYEVTSANPAQLGATFSAVNCSNAAVTALCTAVAGASDAKPTDVLVVAHATTTTADFQIAAISG